MGLEPAFAKNTVAWPPAGIGGWPVEPDDPKFAIPRDALKIGARDTVEKTYLADQSPVLAVTASEPLAPKIIRAKARNSKWLAAVFVSCALHAAVAMFFIARSDQEQVLIEGSADAGITLLGNASEDQSASGEMSEIDPSDIAEVSLITMLDAKPVETIETRAAPAPEAIEPVEAAVVAVATSEAIQPVADEPVLEAMVEPLPEILAVDRLEPVEDDNVVQKPTEAARVEPEKPIEKVEPTPEPVPRAVDEVTDKPLKKAEPKPVKKPENKAEQPKKTDTAPAKREKASRAGSGGNNQADARRGEADGAANGTTMTKGKNGKSATAGNAAASNYPGKVVSKLRRALRSISRSARAKAQNDVHVGFVVDASGGVGGVRIVQSSGSADIDRAALDTVRRAAPFPPIPPEAGRSSWAFTLPLGVVR